MWKNPDPDAHEHADHAGEVERGGGVHLQRPEPAQAGRLHGRVPQGGPTAGSADGVVLRQLRLLRPHGLQPAQEPVACHDAAAEEEEDARDHGHGDLGDHRQQQQRGGDAPVHRQPRQPRLPAPRDDLAAVLFELGHGAHVGQALHGGGAHPGQPAQAQAQRDHRERPQVLVVRHRLAQPVPGRVHGAHGDVHVQVEQRGQQQRGRRRQQPPGARHRAQRHQQGAAAGEH
eukprot:CAMPEP_0194727570 /NCGR_PEP_ID=MMETSP0296-20130528/34939_1 /TAXON_ID=39354 /ORGANISM="Heterosigma akashiwo, Strain CCMP2393" /LENGTH=229 /DNA_ID=CAMNT_0039632999 /DNA_START=246 /DNA_END=932 /DNA_ORIENTATION=-